MMIPTLFPITLIAIVNIYVTDRLLLAYHFQQPEKMDMEMLIIAARYLKGAPLCMFILGYWAMGNRQMYFNIHVPKQYFSDPINPDHSYAPLDKSTELMMIVMFVFLVLFKFVVT